jgi:hypothetical protein
MASMAIEPGLASKEARRKRHEQRKDRKISKTVRNRNAHLGAKRWYHPSKPKGRQSTSPRRRKVEVVLSQPRAIEPSPAAPSLATSTDRRFFDPAVDNRCDLLRKEVGKIDIELLTVTRRGVERRLRKRRSSLMRQRARAA